MNNNTCKFFICGLNEVYKVKTYRSRKRRKIVIEVLEFIIYNIYYIYNYFVIIIILIQVYLMKFEFMFCHTRCAMELFCIMV